MLLLPVNAISCLTPAPVWKLNELYFPRVHPAIAPPDRARLQARCTARCMGCVHAVCSAFRRVPASGRAHCAATLILKTLTPELCVGRLPMAVEPAPITTGSNARFADLIQVGGGAAALVAHLPAAAVHGPGHPRRHGDRRHRRPRVREIPLPQSPPLQSGTMSLDVCSLPKCSVMRITRQVHETKRLRISGLRSHIWLL